MFTIFWVKNPRFDPKLGEEGWCSRSTKLGCWLLFSIVFCNILMVEESKICDFRLKIRRGYSEKGGRVLRVSRGGWSSIEFAQRNRKEGGSATRFASWRENAYSSAPNWVLIATFCIIITASERIWPKEDPKHWVFSFLSIWPKKSVPFFLGDLRPLFLPLGPLFLARGRNTRELWNQTGALKRNVADRAPLWGLKYAFSRQSTVGKRA